jgi:hypothetical protein
MSFPGCARAADPMHLTCYPTVWDESKGLVPVAIQELQIVASPDELKALARFLDQSARALASEPESQCRESFPDSKPGVQSAVSVSVSGPAPRE